MDFSMKKGQDLYPSGFKSRRARHHSGSKPPQFFVGPKFSLGPFKSLPAKSSMSRNTRYTPLLADPEIRRWHANVARGSRITADVYLRRLGAFYTAHNVSIRRIVELSKQDMSMHPSLTLSAP